MSDYPVIASLQDDDTFLVARKRVVTTVNVPWSELSGFISAGRVGFMEGASDTPTGNPTDTSTSALYLGNVNNTLYIWSVALQAWRGLITI